jgi:uncharacterized protein YecT (DUF1311 family)
MPDLVTERMGTAMRHATLVLCAFAYLAGGALPAAAQISTQFQACNKQAKTQVDIDNCASGELTLRNKQMQSVYLAILSRAAGQPKAVAKITAMQQAWLAYVSSYLEALYPAPNKQAEYGSIYPTEFALARAALVERHVADLKAVLANLKNH